MQVKDQSARMQRGVGWVLVSFLTTWWVFCHPSKAIADVVPAAPASDLRSVVLTGKIVTMNAARDVWPNGALWVHNGVIVAVARDREALESAVGELPNPAGDAQQIQALRAARVVHVNGVIYPGLIDLHNHPEYAIYPLLPIKRKYKDRYEWRFYDDDYARRITNLNTLLTAPHYLDLALEVGRYGEYKALVGGTTSLQGGRANLAYAKEECLVRNIETSPVASRLAFSRVDIGRDAAEWQRMREERNNGMLVVHLAEGVGPRMANEFEALKRSGLLGPELVAIHGVGLTGVQFKEMASVGAKLVWSPLSNFLLYGQTADIAVARAAGVKLSLAPDWTPSGSKSILGELKVADLVNIHQLGGTLSNRELVEMVTINPAEAMGWQGRLGTIAPGYLADLVIVDDSVDDPYRNLVLATEENVRLVMIRGDALYGDQTLMGLFRFAGELEVLPVGRQGVSSRAASRVKVLAPNCPATSLPKMSFQETAGRLQQALLLRPADVAKRISLEQFSKDFLICGAGKPNDVPTSADAQRLLACRFQLPFETTRLSPLATNADTQFFKTLVTNPNLPSYLKRLPGYYSTNQGAKRSTTQSPAGSIR
ncbi:MAG: amidohydrolase family protein [Burkholderiales bacterium]|jgi:5-methylthioadenosine/S-adenosylhomocysteine deaminase|nr:amidohydrolase family protein [Betaproteobacteria bacterium]